MSGGTRFQSQFLLQLSRLARWCSALARRQSPKRNGSHRSVRLRPESGSRRDWHRSSSELSLTAKLRRAALSPRKTAGILSFFTICRLKRQFACQRQFIFLRLGVERHRSLGKKFNRARRTGIVKAKNL